MKAKTQCDHNLTIHNLKKTIFTECTTCLMLLPWGVMPLAEVFSGFTLNSAAC